MVGIRAIAVVVAVAAVTGARGVAASPSQLTPPQRTQLLRTYLPVLFFHSREDWAPTSVETFLQRARLERQVSRDRWQPQAGPLPVTSRGCLLSPCFRLNLPCSLRRGDACYQAEAATVTNWSRGSIYGRIVDVPAGTQPPPGLQEAPRYLVRYWLFYYFDDWRSLHDRLWQAHEGDWESVTVGLGADLSPLFAAYSEHCTGTVRPWQRVTVRGTHPVAYVALGSHANYFANSRHPTEFSQCLHKYRGSRLAERLVKIAQDRVSDRTGTAHVLTPTKLQLVELPPPLPTWARFVGRWSEPQLLWLGRTPRRLTTVTEGLGPATPRWTGTSVPSFWHSASS